MYREFVFGSLSPVGITLDEHLGPRVKEQLDLFIDLSPAGELDVTAGVHKYGYRANVQACVVERQTTTYLEQHRLCSKCGRKHLSKGQGRSTHITPNNAADFTQNNSANYTPGAKDLEYP